MSSFVFVLDRSRNNMTHSKEKIVVKKAKYRIPRPSPIRTLPVNMYPGKSNVMKLPVAQLFNGWKKFRFWWKPTCCKDLHYSASINQHKSPRHSSNQQTDLQTNTFAYKRLKRTLKTYAAFRNLPECRIKSTKTRAKAVKSEVCVVKVVTMILLDTTLASIDKKDTSKNKQNFSHDDRHCFSTFSSLVRDFKSLGE